MTEYRDWIDRERLTQILRDLVRIPSVNPGFPNGQGEGEAAGYVRRFFASLGLCTIVQSVEAGRDNVIGMLPGAKDIHVLLEAHMDTVQTSGMSIDPFGGTVRNGRLYGRGACDTKASLAAMLLAVETLVKRGVTPAAHLHVAAVVDEEITYRGVARLAEHIAAGRLRYDAAIVGEPTNLNVIVAHKGVVRFHVDVHGVAAHSSTPASGVNAIENMAEVVLYLKRMAQTEYPAQRHPLTGAPTLCISMIQGGIAPNTVAEHCRIAIDRRTIPGEDSYEVWKQLKARLESWQAEIPGLRLEVQEPFVLDYSMEVPVDHPFVVSLSHIARQYEAGSQIIGAPYGSDASKLTRVGVPTVVFGPGDVAQAHTHDEWVDLEQVAEATAILIHNAMHFGS
jgi:acetylornithine deacetylase/succinyl-diaminopimelate desuccinylase family protein